MTEICHSPGNNLTDATSSLRILLDEQYINDIDFDDDSQMFSESMEGRLPRQGMAQNNLSSNLS